MKYLTTTIAALVAAAILATAGDSNAMPADAQRPENVASVRTGQIIAERYCSRCHAIGRTGISPNPKSPPFRLIAERYPEHNPAPVLIDGIVIRHPGMPEFRLLEHETDGLVAYLRRISRKWRPGR